MVIRDLMPFGRTRGNVPVRRVENESPFYSLQRDMNRMFDSFFRDFNLTPFESGYGPSFPTVDVREDDNEIIVSAELPGVDDKDIDVSVSEDHLTIRGEKREEREERARGFYHMERSYGSFHRDIPLPCDVKDDKIEATFRRGVLTITLPKKEEGRRRTKRIEVKTV